MQLIELYKPKEFLLFYHLSLVSFFLENSLEIHVFEGRHKFPSSLNLSRCRSLIIHGWRLLKLHLSNEFSKAGIYSYDPQAVSKAKVLQTNTLLFYRLIILFSCQSNRFEQCQWSEQLIIEFEWVLSFAFFLSVLFFVFRFELNNRCDCSSRSTVRFTFELCVDGYLSGN